jgi:lipopolysaccharide/colanic/teichoic acid biosynthesis glycosyltransferase
MPRHDHAPAYAAEVDTMLAEFSKGPDMYAPVFPERPPARAEPIRERAAFHPAAGWYTRTKRLAELLFALTLLVLTAPILLVVMVLVKLTSRGPALYSQTRVGLNGKPFTLYKVRSMTVQAESLTGATWCKPGDNRVTFLGRWLRRTHLDELPQLWNILKGDMSLIGPRPERPEFVPQLEQALPLYRHRLVVRPGLTGLAQVQLPPDTDLESVRRKLAHDLFYVQHVTWWLDFRVLSGTFLHMIGVPFRFIRFALAFPHPRVIESAYRSALSKAGDGDRVGAGKTHPAPSVNGTAK